MTKILPKETTATSRCHIQHIFILICLLCFTCTSTTQYNSIPQFGTSLWLCSHPHLRPGYSSWLPITEELLSHVTVLNYLAQEALVTTFCGEVFQQSPVVTTFPIYYCTLETIIMTCHYTTTSSRKKWWCNVQSVLILGWSCLQAGLNHNVLLGWVSATHWKLCQLTIVATAAK